MLLPAYAKIVARPDAKKILFFSGKKRKRTSRLQLGETVCVTSSCTIKEEAG